MSFYTENELHNLGLKTFGKKVLISKKCSIYGPENISIGNNVRIDDFSILSATKGYININSHIHIAAYCSLFGAGGIVMKDFSAISSYTAIYSSSDNYNGNFLIGPTMDENCRELAVGEVIIDLYATCGSHAVVLPKVHMREGSILGACSMAYKSLEPWSIYSGVPCNRIMKRKKGLIEKAEIMNKKWS